MSGMVVNVVVCTSDTSPSEPSSTRIRAVQVPYGIKGVTYEYSYVFVPKAGSTATGMRAIPFICVMPFGSTISTAAAVISSLPNGSDTTALTYTVLPGINWAGTLPPAYTASYTSKFVIAITVSELRPINE